MLSMVLAQVVLIAFVVRVNTRYLLVQIDVDRGLYSSEYPIEIHLNPEITKDKCPSADLKKRGKFTVQRTEKEVGRPAIQFTAILDPDEKEPRKMCTLNVMTKNSGECDHVGTEKAFEGCALAVYMMATCFQDDKVLGPDGKGYLPRLSTPAGGMSWKDEPRKGEVIAQCQSMIFLRCKPNPGTSLEACISYLRGARLAHYDLVFMKHAKQGIMNAWKVGDYLESKYKGHADTFIKENGRTWFFCKCTDKRPIDSDKQKCLAMATGRLL